MMLETTAVQEPEAASQDLPLPADRPQPPTDLLETDGVPLDSDWHREAINLLVEILYWWFQPRTDYFAGGNMFIYFSKVQARNLDYRGPDFFFVKNVDGTRDRKYWAIWDEDGRYPDLIIELLSHSTAKEDRTTKKQIYEQTFRTREYFIYDWETQLLEGWRLDEADRYQPLSRNELGRMWSKELELWIGPARGSFHGRDRVWLRFFAPDGRLLPHGGELIEMEGSRLETERQRAQAAAAELAQLKARLAELEKK